MPGSAAPFVAKTAVGFTPATPASVVSGTATAVRTAAGNYGISIGASATVVMDFPLTGVGQAKVELFPPYEQYNQPKTITPKQNYLTVYYTVSGAALTSGSVTIYATSFGSTGATVTTLLASTALSTAIGTYAVQVSLKSLAKVPVPNSIVVAEVSIVTASGGAAVVNGVSFN